MAVAQRVQRLRQKLAEKESDVILISQAENRCYLSGFDGSAGFLLISQSQSILAVDFRYVEQAKFQAPEFEVIRIKGGLSEWLPDLISDLRARRLGFEASDISFVSYQKLAEVRDKVDSQIQLVPTEGLVESLRAVKEEEEVAFLTRAAELADASFEYAASIIRPGVREKETAWEVEKFLREKGSGGMPFDIIVASGENSALPHAKPTERIIRDREPVLLDLGARVGGYCSNLSRTICLGSPDLTFTKIYDLVREAQVAALANMETGMSGEQVDRLAREVIEGGGYGEAFGHGLGHGVGLAPHELPRLSYDSTDMLAEDMVFTLEPGIYLAGWGGVRIEDMVILEKGKAKVLTKARK